MGQGKEGEGKANQLRLDQETERSFRAVAVPARRQKTHRKSQQFVLADKKKISARERTHWREVVGGGGGETCLDALVERENSC